MSNQKNAINKVFGIGLSHTGTRSLDKALNILGIKSIHWPLDRKTYRELSNGIYKLSILEKYQAVTDITTVPVYPQLDKTYPGSKFILTIRDKKSWLESMERVNRTEFRSSKLSILLTYWKRSLYEMQHYGRAAKVMRFAKFIKFMINSPHERKMIEFQRIAVFGAIAFNDNGKDRFSYLYDTHYKNVLDYFKGRPNDLLVIDVCKGGGWELLCTFLSKPIPDTLFPYVKAKINFSDENTS